jgi:Regulator of chromosome condensation (RCC1) repeat/HYR domain
MIVIVERCHGLAALSVLALTMMACGDETSSSGGGGGDTNDTTPPVLSLPEPISVSALGVTGTPVSYVVSAVDGVDGDVPVTCDPPSDSPFVVGLTAVSCSASDSAGNVAQGSFDVTVTNAVVQIDAGGAHTCAVTADGSAYCWGENDMGQLGNGTTDGASGPVLVDTGVTSVSAGVGHSCAVYADFGVRCWGSNSVSQLGDGTSDDSFVPIQTFGITSAIDVTANGTHSCAALADGDVRCWGRVQSGQGSQLWSADQPQSFSGFMGTTAVSSGEDHNCGLMNDVVACWGNDFADQLSTGPQADETTIATNVPDVPPSIAISAGTYHSCAVSADGPVYCWGGFNQQGQLGHGSTDDEDNAVQVSGIDAATDVAAGAAHSCAALADQTVRCWGENTSGKLGNGAASNSATPVDVVNLVGATAVTAGGTHSCALANGLAYCWGSNARGQLGDGTGTSSNVPVQVLLP